MIELVNIGHENYVDPGRVCMVLNIKSQLTKRLIQQAEEAHRLADVTFGRLTRSAVLLDNGWLILTSMRPLTARGRFVKAG